MAQIPFDRTRPSPCLSRLEIEVATVLLNDSHFNSARITEQPFPAGGYFRTVWKRLDGRFVTYLHSWATGTGYLMLARAYFDKFRQPLPSWAVRMPPAVCLRLCNMAISADQTLPAACPQAGNGGAMYVQMARLVEGAELFRSA
jgi:hypothetical protein